MKKKYTNSEINFLHDNFGKMNFSKLAEKLNRTEEAIRLKCNKLNIKAQESLQGHDLISETEFIKELIELNVNIPIYQDLKKRKLIKVKGEKWETKFLKPSEYEKWKKFFSENYSSHYVKTKIDKKWHKSLDKWLNYNCVKSVILTPEKSTHKYWIPKKEFQNLEELLKNYLPIQIFASEAGYTTDYINKLRKKGVLKNVKFFANKFWYNKIELLTLKARYKNL